MYEQDNPQNKLAAAQVWRTSFWMAHYDSLTPKGHLLYSNSQAINLFDMGRLCRKTLQKGLHRTCKYYTDKNGVARFTATKHLKKTEILGMFVDTAGAN